MPITSTAEFSAPGNTSGSSMPTSYKNATGPIRYGMTNDYMFHVVLQKNNYVLKGLICALLSLDPGNVTSVVITNPIALGDSVDDKEFILDINVNLNNNAVINLEMQMAYQVDWEERSLSYLCRSFDQLLRGSDYGDIKPVIHIGFLNFSPHKTLTPEFYASYRMLNEKTHEPYSDKLLLRVVNLTQIDLATEQDRANRIDYWARLFTAASWEEIQMIAQNDSFLSSASQSLYESNADELTRQRCRAREDYYRVERSLANLKVKNQALEEKIDSMDKELAEKDKLLEESRKLIEKYRKRLQE